LLSLGEFDLDGYDKYGWILFIIATIVNCIVMLNLLISIFSQVHDDFQTIKHLQQTKSIQELSLDSYEIMCYFSAFADEKKKQSNERMEVRKDLLNNKSQIESN